MASVYQSIPPNQFGLPTSRVKDSRRLQFVSHSPSDHWKQAECISCPLVKDQSYSRPITPASHHTSVNLHQLRAHQSFSLPMFHPDQFKIRPTEPARLPHNRVSHRFKPYWKCKEHAKQLENKEETFHVLIKLSFKQNWCRKQLQNRKHLPKVACELFNLMVVTYSKNCIYKQPN